MSENRCVCCGEVIPEGWQYCRRCLVETDLRRYEDMKKRNFKKKWKEFWKKVKKMFKKR